MKRSRRIGSGLALVASCLAVSLAWADSTEEKEAPTRGQGHMRHGAHAPLHPGMRARMQAHDARLDELVAAMNAVEGEAKIDAIAAVVNELVAQRRTRRDHIEERWKQQQGRHGEKGQRGEKGKRGGPQ